MRMPRNLAGVELAVLLQRRYGYYLIRQRGSHMRLASDFKGYPHQVSVPRHRPLKVGALAGILRNVAAYLEIEEDALMLELFG